MTQTSRIFQIVPPLPPPPIPPPPPNPPPNPPPVPPPPQGIQYYMNVLVADDASEVGGGSLTQVSGQLIVNSSSTLFGKTVNVMRARMAKTGVPTGTITIKIVDVNLSTKYTFGTIQAEQLSTLLTDYVFVGPSAGYTLTTDDRAVIEFRGGDANNFVLLAFITAEQFDGLNCIRARYGFEPVTNIGPQWFTMAPNDASIGLGITGNFPPPPPLPPPPPPPNPPPNPPPVPPPPGQVGVRNIYPQPVPIPTTGYVIVVSISGSTVTATQGGSTISSSTNASTVLNAAVAAARANTSTNKTIHIRPGTYNLPSAISLDTLSNCTIQGENRNTTILKCVTAGEDVMNKNSDLPSNNVTLYSLTFDGNNICHMTLNTSANLNNLTIRYCINQFHNNSLPGAYIVDDDGVLCEDCIWRNPHNDGDTVAFAGSNYLIQFCECERGVAPGSVAGGSLTSGHYTNCEIRNCWFHDTDSYAYVSLENFGTFNGVKIHDNLFERMTGGDAILSLGYSNGGTGNTISNVEIYNNTFRDLNESAIKLNAFDAEINTLSTNQNVHNNNIMRTNGRPIFAGPLQFSQISNNTIDNGGHTFPAIHLYPGHAGDPTCHDVTMNNNIITNAPVQYQYTGCTNVFINGVKVA